MTIAVRFPDGSIQNVPAQLREISDPACPDTAPRFERVPLNCDSNWTYHRRGEKLVRHAARRQSIDPPPGSGRMVAFGRAYGRGRCKRYGSSKKAA